MTKQEVQTVLESLPEDCTLEDVQYRLYVIQKVKSGLEAVDRGEGVEHEEATKRLGKWLSK
ncbi:MAG TPA: hypothetical protein VG722_11915 [Tepidisphaeraceae bacterium]|nr:hypothetical protein [Tepidisphaeraceae bacterium]